MIKARLNRALSQLPEGIAFDFSPPAIPGVGTSGGFTFVLEDRAGKDVQFLANNLNTFLAAARKRPEIAGVSTTFLGSVPQQFINVDRDKVSSRPSPSAMFTGPFRPSWGDCSSTTSIASAASGRFTSRPRATTERGRKTSGNSMSEIKMAGWFRSPH